MLVFWRVFQVVFTPNLLTNPGFEVENEKGWEIVSQGNAHATPKLSDNESDNTVIVLTIPNTLEGSWVGVGQEVPVEPGRSYEVSLKYRLVEELKSASKVILRVSQLDQTGITIKSDEIISPDFPATNRTGDNPQPTWHSLTYNFVTKKETTAVEIGGGLFGRQASTIEIDDIVIKAQPGWLIGIWQDPFSVLMVVLLAGVGGYKLSRWAFTSISVKRPRVRVSQRLIVIILVNMVLFFVFAELLAVGIYLVRDGELFYTNKKIYEPIGEDTNDEITRRRIHPYFGYVDKSGVTHKPTNARWRFVEASQQNINNHGLLSEVDYPFIKANENQYIIGIFGGSVADVFAVVGKEKLVENLQQNDFFKDKEIIVLDFAKGGYKQPQQLMLVTYFLSIGQDFDMVINIDGFNELTMGYRNNQDYLDISMPSTTVMQGFSKLTDQNTTEKIGALANINRDKRQLNELARIINNNKFASLNFVLEQYYTFRLNRYEEEINNFSQTESPNYPETSLLFMTSVEELLEDHHLFEEIATMWAENSIIMNQLLSTRGINYFHVLQPNQYYSNRVFSSEEAAIALDDNISFKPIIEQGYPAFIAKFDTLKENHVNFYNGIPIFDNELGIVYIDDCCHYTQLGNDLLADFIAKSILESADFYGVETTR